MKCAFWPSLASCAAISFGGRGVAELLDAHTGVRLLGGGDGGQRLVDELLDLLVGAGHREVHDDGATVLGDGVDAVGRIERALDLGDASDRAEAAHDVLDGRGDLRIVSLDRALALDQHLLAGLVGEPGGRDDHVAALGLAAARLGVVDRVQPDPPADDGGEHDEQDPADDGQLAVLRAPSTGSRREITGLIQDLCSFKGAWGGLPAAFQSPPRGVGGRQASRE